MQEQQSPVEAALAELNNNLAVARTQAEDHVVLPKQTAVWVRDLLEDLAEGRLVRPPEPEWGLMLNTLRQSIYVNPWVCALPGLMIFITSICFNMMSDGLRAAMDVKS